MEEVNEKLPCGHPENYSTVFANPEGGSETFCFRCLFEGQTKVEKDGEGKWSNK